MDAATLSALRAALAATPENVELACVVARALLSDGQPADAARVLRAVPDASFATVPQRALRATVLLAVGDAAGAVAATEGATGEALVARARALHALGKASEATSAYEAAVRENATLEDGELRALLASRAVGGKDGRPAMRVIATGEDADDVVKRILVPHERGVTFADVGGLAEVKEEIHRRIVLPFVKPSLFQRFKKRVGGGILLYGPPGCGKTLLARATAGEANARFFHVAIHDVLDMYIGESERKLRAVFETARVHKPAVLFFDEMEALAGKRQYARESNSAKVVSQLLSELDGFEQSNDGLLVLGATNVPWAVDPAFRRPGRFDRVLFVPPPDREARARVLRLTLADRPVAPDVDPDRLAERTGGFSGADLANLVETAADHAVASSLERGEEVPIGRAHLDSALKKLRPTTTEWLSTARNYARYANEAGQYDEVLAFLETHAKR